MTQAQVTVYQADSRRMPELASESIDLVVTSPPYWHLKDYGVPGQIGYGQTLHAYLRDLYRVWQEVFRVLKPGRRLCVNIGDQFARAAVYGRYKVIPLHAEVIAQAEQIGFDYLGAIIWQKKTTLNTTGGAPIMGSYPFPPNGIVEIDYEYILLFKKPGKTTRVPRQVKEASRLSKEEWKTFFQGHWRFGGARQVQHEAVFPPELPRRLIRMFSFVGETVLDPFAGSGTTLAEALRLGRRAVGYEIVPAFVDLMREKFAAWERGLFQASVAFFKPERPGRPWPEISYRPGIQDAAPIAAEPPPAPAPLHRVRSWEPPDWLVLEDGARVGLLGVEITDVDGFAAYARRYLIGKQIFYKEPRTLQPAGLRAYVYLKNRIFVNAYALKAGLGRPSAEAHRWRQHFERWAQEAAHAQGMGPQHGHQSLGPEQEVSATLQRTLASLSSHERPAAQG